MVRAAVRTLTLQMYGLQDDGIQQFLVSQPASNFFNEVAIIIAEHCQVSFPALGICLAGNLQESWLVQRMRSTVYFYLIDGVEPMTGWYDWQFKPSSRDPHKETFLPEP